jgi:hypothetical protein
LNLPLGARQADWPEQVGAAAFPIKSAESGVFPQGFSNAVFGNFLAAGVTTDDRDQTDVKKPEPDQQNRHGWTSPSRPQPLHLQLMVHGMGALSTNQALPPTPLDAHQPALTARTGHGSPTANNSNCKDINGFNATPVAPAPHQHHQALPKFCRSLKHQLSTGYANQQWHAGRTPGRLIQQEAATIPMAYLLPT